MDTPKRPPSVLPVRRLPFEAYAFALRSFV